MRSRLLAKWVNIISLIGGTEAPFKTLESFEHWSFFLTKGVEQRLETKARDGGRFMLKTVPVGSLDAILHLLCDERKLLLSPGIARGRFSRERRLFLFFLRWGAYNQNVNCVRSDFRTRSDLVPVGLCLPWRLGVQGSSHSEPQSEQTRVWTELQSHQDHPSLPSPEPFSPLLNSISLSLSMSLYPGDSVDMGSPAQGAVPQVTLVLAEAHIDLLLTPDTAAQPFRGGEFD